MQAACRPGLSDDGVDITFHSTFFPIGLLMEKAVGRLVGKDDDVDTIILRGHPAASDVEVIQIEISLVQPTRFTSAVGHQPENFV